MGVSQTAQVREIQVGLMAMKTFLYLSPYIS
jgi:hypothetical protein